MRLRTRNLNLKLIALALAVATWFAVRGGTIEKSDWLACPVTLSLPDNVVVQKRDALSVEIKVQGPLEKIEDFHPDDRTLSIDARPGIERAFAGGATSATIDVRITPDDFRLPRRLEVFKFEPESIQLRVERRQRTVLPVEVTTFGRVADGHRIAEARAMPSTVTLDLGVEEAAGISVVETTPVNVTGRSTTLRDKAFLLDPRSNRGERLGERVEVVVTIAPVLQDKDLKAVPIMVLKRPNDRRRIEVDPGTITIKVRGRADLLASLGPEAATAYVSVREEMAAGYTYTLVPAVTVKTPGVELVSVPEVKVTISSGDE